MLSFQNLKKRFINSILATTIFITAFSVINQKEAFALNPDITIPLGQVAPFQVPEGITTLVIGDPTIAEVVVPPGQNKMALINTKASGTTNILVWTEKGGQPNNFILEVQENKREEQIITRVKVLEVTTGSDGKFGIDWLDTLAFKEAPPSAPFKFGLPIRTTTIEANIDTLVNDRKAKILAQPTLVSLNGKEAKFLSGGEQPVIITERDRTTIQWKEYGIKLELKAIVQGSDSILLNIKPEVSSIDKANSVVLSGTGSANSTVIPAFNTRKADTTLVLRDNESVVVSGLMNNSQEYIDRKVPLLGDIPYLGFLFKSREFRDVHSELIFVVSPSILKNNQVNPEKGYANEANDMKKQNQ